MLSILHISDLHRSAEDPLSNEEIVEALITDRLRYTKGEAPITIPNAVVVSGDVIQGVGLNHANPDVEIADQYKVAEDLVTRIANEFLRGDRSRLIIAPRKP